VAAADVKKQGYPCYLLCLVMPGCLEVLSRRWGVFSVRQTVKGTAMQPRTPKPPWARFSSRHHLRWGACKWSMERLPGPEQVVLCNQGKRLGPCYWVSCVFYFWAAEVR